MILCVCVILNKRSFEPLCVWILLSLFTKPYAGSFAHDVRNV